MWLDSNFEKYDVIFIDFPDPSNFSLGKFIQSPSLKYKQQVYKGGAVVSEK